MARNQQIARGSIRTRLLSALIFLGTIAPFSQAAQSLRVGVFETMAYPFIIFDGQRNLTGGLLKDLGDQLARDLGATPAFFPLSRRRVEPGLAAGNIDVICYFSPKWADNANIMNWSTPMLPQIERVVTKRGEASPSDVAGKRVVVQLGYHYPSINALFDSGRATRIDETKVPMMFKALDSSMADILISSEGEIEGYFAAQPEQRARFEVSTAVFSRTDTHCAISKKSRFTTETINKAIDAMTRRGDIERLAKRYGMSMR